MKKGTLRNWSLLCLKVFTAFKLRQILYSLLANSAAAGKPPWIFLLSVCCSRACKGKRRAKTAPTAYVLQAILTLTTPPKVIPLFSFISLPQQKECNMPFMMNKAAFNGGEQALLTSK